MAVKRLWWGGDRLYGAADELDGHISIQLTQCDLPTQRQQNSNMQPRLRYVARNVLFIPAASKASQRKFSAAGQTMLDRRCLLQSESVHELFLPAFQ